LLKTGLRAHPRRSTHLHPTHPTSRTRPPKPTTRRRDKPTQSEATPICTSSIRLHLHLAHTCPGGRCQGVQVFVVFHSWMVSPHGHARQNPEPAAGTSPPTPKRIPFARRPSVPVRESVTESVDHPTDTPAEIQNPPRDKRHPVRRRLPFARRPFILHPSSFILHPFFPPTDTLPETHNPPHGQPHPARSDSHLRAVHPFLSVSP